jgi:hypothetical protein
MPNSYNYYLWYNPQDKHYFTQYSPIYQGLGIQAHLAAHYANAFSGLLNETQKNYFVDPETVAFQRYHLDNFFNDNGIRTSWEKLLDLYPDVLKRSLLQRRSLTSLDLRNRDGSPVIDFRLFIEQIFQFQETIIQNKIIGLSAFMTFQPQINFLIIPYFYFEAINDEWYNINKILINESITIPKTLPKYTTICISKEILYDENNIMHINRDYNIQGVDGFLLWVDDFDEIEAGNIYLDNLIKLIKTLSSDGKPVLNLYGGYFSIINKYWGLKGHVEGVGYRNSRSITQAPIKSGPPSGPVPKYYIPKLHTRVVIDQGQRIISQFNDLGCNCGVCRLNPQAYNPLTPQKERREILNRHFLETRAQEIFEIENNRYNDVLSELEQIYQRYGRFGAILPINHFQNWLQALRNNINLL